MRYFLLDKKFLLKQPCQARVIAMSDKEFSEEEIQKAKEEFNTKETVVYIGNDIPYNIEYDTFNNSIKETKIKTQVNEIEERVMPIKSENVFDENIEVKPNVLYFYIDKKKADERGLSETKATFEKPLLNPLQYFGVETYLVKGNNIPYYVTVDNGAIREATEYEKYKKGQRILAENEAVLESKKEIVTIFDGQYIENDNVITVEIPENIVKPIWNKDTHQWYDGATDLDKVQAQIDEYSAMDTPSILKEMGAELANECIDMLIQLRNMAYEIQSTTEVDGKSFRSMSMFTKQELTLPQPSQELKDFKNKINKIIR